MAEKYRDKDEELDDLEIEKPNSSAPNDDSDSDDDDQSKRQRVSPSPITGFMFSGMPASPPKFVSLEQIMKAANGVTNMVLCHEISVNKDFRLEKVEPSKNCLESQVKCIVHKAFWDILKFQLNDEPPCYDHAMILLTEVKEGLQSLLLPQHTFLQTQIDEILDLELIHQQTEKGTLDVSQHAQFILSIMGRICAPVRDERIRELTATTDIMDLFKGILELIDLMKLDMANFTIEQFRPHIQQHSVEYERNKFQEFLESQQEILSKLDGLEYTRQWLRRAFDIVDKSHDPSDTGEFSVKLDINNTITKAYMELLQWTSEYMFPETILIDQKRFMDLRDKVTNGTLVGSVLLVSLGTVGPSIQGLADFKETMKQHLTILLEKAEDLTEPQLTEKLKDVAEQVVKNVNESLTNRGFEPMNKSKTEILKGQIEDIYSPNHSVRKLMRMRLLDFVEQVISSSTASPIRIPPGLSVLQSELAHITGQFLRLVTHNRAVFSDYYVKIIEAFSEGKTDIESAPSSSH